MPCASATTFSGYMEHPGKIKSSLADLFSNAVRLNTAILVLLLVFVGCSLIATSFYHKHTIRQFLDFEIKGDITVSLTAANDQFNAIAGHVKAQFPDKPPASMREFLSFTDHLHKAYPLLHIRYISPERQVVFVSPNEINEWAGVLKDDFPERRKALEKAQAGNKAVLSDPFEVAGGGYGYMLIIPGRGNDYFEVLFTAKDFFSQQSFTHILAKIYLMAEDGPHVIFDSSWGARFSKLIIEHEYEIRDRLFDRPIVIKLFPKPGGEKQSRQIWIIIAPAGIGAIFILLVLVINGQAKQIKEREEYERVLESQAHLKQSFLDGLPFPAFLLNPKDRKVVFVNKAASERGVKPGETCFGGWFKSAVPCSHCPLDKGQSADSCQIKQTDDGKVWDVRFVGISDELCMHLYVDVTSRMAAEDELRKTTGELTMLLTSLPIILYTAQIDESVTLRYISGKVEEITGFTQEDFRTDNKLWVERIHLEDRDRALKDYFFAECGSEIRRDVRFRKKNGELIWLRNIFHLQKKETGAGLVCTGVWLDVSSEMNARKESESRLQQVVQADKLAAIGEVVAGVAHEINNPLSFITYNTPIMKQIWNIFFPALKQYDSEHPEWFKGGFSLAELSRNMDEIVEAIETGTTRITSVVSNLKDFAQIDATGGIRNCSINDIINKTLTIVGAQLRKKIGNIRIQLDDNLPEIKGSPLKLEQVIANLLVNATHAVSDKQTAKLSVRSRYVQNLDSVLIEIEDNGIGIEREHLSKIMDPFFTTRRDSGGTGLGLSVSYGLVQEHKGTIAVLSRPGQGTRFSVFLPVGGQHSAHIVIQPSLLLVDDNVAFLELLKRYFYKIDDTNIGILDSPDMVIEHLDNNPQIDFVISDIEMPEIDGWELMEKIKEKYPLLAVILYSGRPDLLLSERGKYTPDRCLSKPLTGKDILHNINEIGRMQVWGSS